MRLFCYWLTLLSCTIDNVKASTVSEVPEDVEYLTIRETSKDALEKRRHANITESRRAYVNCHSTFERRDRKK